MRFEYTVDFSKRPRTFFVRSSISFRRRRAGNERTLGASCLLIASHLTPEPSLVQDERPSGRILRMRSTSISSLNDTRS